MVPFLIGRMDPYILRAYSDGKIPGRKVGNKPPPPISNRWGPPRREGFNLPFQERGVPFPPIMMIEDQSSCQVARGYWHCNGRAVGRKLDIGKP